MIGSLSIGSTKNKVNFFPNDCICRRQKTKIIIILILIIIEIFIIIIIIIIKIIIKIIKKIKIKK